MKYLRTLRQDLNKTVINAGFIGAALMTCLLAFTGNAYRDDSNDKSYSILEAFFSFDRKFVETHDSFSSYRLFCNGLSGYISMFIPIIVAFPFMVSFCAERNNGLIRFTITRAGKLRYYLSKFAASFIGGGLAVLLGMAIFGIILRFSFPTFMSYDPDPETLKWSLPDGEAVGVIKVLLSSFLYGAFSTLPAFFLSSFCKNPYIITCLPFMLVYVWNTAMNKIIFHGYETGDWEVYNKVAPFQPDSPMRIVSINFSEMTAADRNTLIFNGVYLAVLLAGFILIMNLRTDKGN
ncbi:MAG: ABC transporter permease [Ruminococcus sp.]|nr:ABC transporter permease [Ruminococcus sp.]